MIGSGLHGHDDEIAWSDLAARSRRVHFCYVDVFGFAPEAEAAFAHDFIVVTEKKMHVAAEVRELASVVKTNRAGADDRDPEIRQDVTGSHKLN